jgi:hypothetical protein
MSQRIVSAMFDSHDEAERAVSELRRAGVRDNALSIVAQHDGKTTETHGDGTEHKDHGSLIRGLLGGGAMGAGLGVVALAIPGVGPLAAAGAIAASAVPEGMALGAAVGATTAGASEVLTKHGVSEEDSKYYTEHLGRGGVFVSVDTSDAGINAADVEEILYRYGGHSSSRARSTPAAAY